jgi:hypothetical protein
MELDGTTICFSQYVLIGRSVAGQSEVSISDSKTYQNCGKLAAMISSSGSSALICTLLPLFVGTPWLDCLLLTGGLDERAW